MARPSHVEHGNMYGRRFHLKSDLSEFYRRLCAGNGKPPPDKAKYSAGQIVKVVMVSRLGDCGITTNPDATYGYEIRVDPEELYDPLDERCPCCERGSEHNGVDIHDYNQRHKKPAFACSCPCHT